MGLGAIFRLAGRAVPPPWQGRLCDKHPPPALAYTKEKAQRWAGLVTGRNGPEGGTTGRAQGTEKQDTCSRTSPDVTEVTDCPKKKSAAIGRLHSRVVRPSTGGFGGMGMAGLPIQQGRPAKGSIVTCLK